MEFTFRFRELFEIMTQKTCNKVFIEQLQSVVPVICFVLKIRAVDKF